MDNSIILAVMLCAAITAVSSSSADVVKYRSFITPSDPRRSVWLSTTRRLVSHATRSYSASMRNDIVD